MAISFENDDFCGAIVSGQVPRLAAIRSVPLAAPDVAGASAGGVVAWAASGAAVGASVAGACVSAGAFAAGAWVATGAFAVGCAPPQAARIGRIRARSRPTISLPGCLYRFI